VRGNPEQWSGTSVKGDNGRDSRGSVGRGLAAGSGGEDVGRSSGKVEVILGGGRELSEGKGRPGTGAAQRASVFTGTALEDGEDVVCEEDEGGGGGGGGDGRVLVASMVNPNNPYRSRGTSGRDRSRRGAYVRDLMDGCEGDEG